VTASLSNEKNAKAWLRRVLRWNSTLRTFRGYKPSISLKIVFPKHCFSQLTRWLKSTVLDSFLTQIN